MARPAVSSRAECGEPREAGGGGAADDSLLANLDPGVSGERGATTCHPEAEPARNAASPQHRMRSHGARQTKSVHPPKRAETIDGPRYPLCFIMGEPTNTPVWAPRPGEQPCRRQKTHS